MAEGFEVLLLDGAEVGEGLGDDVFERGCGLGGLRGDFAEDVGGEGGIVGSAFDDAPAGGVADFVPAAEEAAGEYFAEEGADADAGEEVALAADLAGLAGVVAEVWLIEGEGHEVGEADGALGGDFGTEKVVQRGGCGRGSGRVNLVEETHRRRRLHFHIRHGNR